jgi:serine/threonine protein kinase
VEDFIVDKKLGEGKFGCVNLVKHKRTNSLFALKKIPKQLIKANMMIDQLALEIRIQSCLKHSNILEMYGCFDDKTHLYIILEYMDGGTLYQRSKK